MDENPPGSCSTVLEQHVPQLKKVRNLSVFYWCLRFGHSGEKLVKNAAADQRRIGEAPVNAGNRSAEPLSSVIEVFVSSWTIFSYSHITTVFKH